MGWGCYKVRPAGKARQIDPRGVYETTLSFVVSLIGRMQHGSGGGFDGLLFSRTNGSGSDAALWGRCRAASGRKQLTAGSGRGGSWITAGAAHGSGRRSRLDRAGPSSCAEFIRAIARACPAVLKYDQCVPNHRVTEDTDRRVGGVFGTHRDFFRWWVPQTPPSLRSSVFRWWVPKTPPTLRSVTLWLES